MANIRLVTSKAIGSVEKRSQVDRNGLAFRPISALVITGENYLIVETFTISSVPSFFTIPVKVHFTETWQLDGQIRTGDQVAAFSDERGTPLPMLVVHWFRFEFNAVLYQFNLVGEQTKGVDPNGDWTAFINPADLSKCWMNNYELVVHLWEPTAEDE